MNLKQYFLFGLKEFKCKFVGHEVKYEVEDILETQDKVDSNCQRCNIPLIIKLDPNDHDYYLVMEAV